MEVSVGRGVEAVSSKSPPTTPPPRGQSLAKIGFAGRGTGEVNVHWEDQRGDWEDQRGVWEAPQEVKEAPVCEGS